MSPHLARPRLPTNFSKPISVDLPISHAGAFCYWVEYDGEEPGSRVKGREGYFNIDPVLRTKSRSSIIGSGSTVSDKGGAVLTDHVNIPLDGLSILTLVSKWMGPLSQWDDYLAEASERGYNMIHWTPLQERGESDSPYSIRNQLVYEPSMFSEKDKAALAQDGGKAKMDEMLRVAREKYGLLSLTDVVLNHTANDSPWLADHPEAGMGIYPPAARCAHSLQVSVRRIPPTLPPPSSWTLPWSSFQLHLRGKAYQPRSRLSRTSTFS